MKIGPILNYQNNLSKNFSLNSNENIKHAQKYSNNDINFKASLVLKKPKINNPDIQKINEKIISYLEKLPPLAKMSKPILFALEKDWAGILVDKSQKKGSFVSIKIADKIETLENWASPNGPHKALEVTFNTAGQMVDGAYYSMPERLTCMFSRNQKNVRRIEYGNATYMPIKNDENVWQKQVPHVIDYQYYCSAQKMKFDNTELQKYFSELAKRETSIFAKK